MAGATILFLLAIFALCGLVGAVIAHSRGGRPLTGFLLGQFLGPIGTLIAFFIGNPSVRAAREAERIAADRLPPDAHQKGPLVSAIWMLGIAAVAVLVIVLLVPFSKRTAASADAPSNVVDQDAMNVTNATN